MSKNKSTGKIIQQRVKDKIQFQTSFTDFPVFIIYCSCIYENTRVHKNDINRILGEARKNHKDSWNNNYDSHAKITLMQYNLIKEDGEYYILDELGYELLNLFDGDFKLIGSREEYLLLTYKMITLWHQKAKDFDVHPGKILLNLMIEPELHGYITSQDVAHIFNNTENRTDGQYGEMLQQIIVFRESGKFYTYEQLKKTYTLLTGYVKWGIFDLDETVSNNLIKVVSLKDDFKNVVKRELCIFNDEVLSDEQIANLVKEVDDISEKIVHLVNLYGNEGRILATRSIRITQVQDAFRLRLIKRYGQKCLLCDITNLEMLVASHIKRDADCKDINEKIDNNNGILLCANHDKLFDRFLISFDGLTGHIMISDKLTFAEKRICMLNPDYVLPEEYMTPERQMYLIWHNSEFEKKNKGENN